MADLAQTSEQLSHADLPSAENDPAANKQSIVVQQFLTGSNLRKVFAHLCNHASGQVTDPISDVVCTMLTCPVHMVVSEVGVAFFKDHPNALYPFSAMDRGQRLYVEDVVTSCMHQHQRLSATGGGMLAGSSSSSSSSFCGSSSNVVMQMGGGCILYTEQPAAAHAQQHQPALKGRQQHQHQQRVGALPHLLKPKDVFEALCDCIFASRRYGNARVRYAVCSIVMQRVVGMTHVSRQDQQAAYRYAMERMKAEEAREEEEEEEGRGVGCKVLL